MEVASNTPLATPNLFTHLKKTPSKMKHFVTNFATKVKNLGQDDPRRIAHSFKVALAITLVSMVYYLRPFYKGMGDAGIWAILTVVVVFEYTVGATLSKGMNRGFATLLAGALGVGAESLASLFGAKGEPIVLGCLVFFLVAAATFSRFIPHIKKRYDYGVLVFILTFSLVSVSGYRVEKIIELAHQRLSTIILGGATCILISICVCPVWAGEDLHERIVNNLEKLASFLEGFGGEYYKVGEEGDSVDGSKEDDKSFLTDYKSVLNSKATEESLANFAWWEPGHGKFRFRHPWKQYLKIGLLSRHCAYHIEALNGYLLPKLQDSSEFQKSVQESMAKMSSEAGKILSELAVSVKSMTHPTNSAAHIEKCKNAINEVNSALRASMIEKIDVVEMVPIFTAISILIDIVKSVEIISEAVEELSQQAHFKKSNLTLDENENEKPHFLHRGSINPVSVNEDTGFVAITVPEIATKNVTPQVNPEEIKK